MAISAADEYCKMLKMAWNAQSNAPQFNLGCRRLAKAHYPLYGYCGLVEREIATLTPLCPDRVKADPVEPGRMFLSDTQQVLGKAGQSLHTQECVQHTFTIPISDFLGSSRVLDVWQVSEPEHPKLLSHKTVFFLTICSTKRVRELYAQSVSLKC